MPTPTPAVLVIGSLHYDIMVDAAHLPQKDETAVGSRWYPKFGGKGGNQAVACARAGCTTRMIGAVGDDDFGRFLRESLRIGGVDDRQIATIPHIGSGISVAITDANGDYAATIVSGANLHINTAALADDAAWHGIGLLVLQNEVAPAVNLAAAAQARRRGVRTLLNAAPARALAPDLIPLIDILVVNAIEAEMMGADKICCLHSAAEAARLLAARFETVIVTAGAQGLAALSAEDELLVLPAEKVSVVSSHGAGDAFIGALAAQLVQGAALSAACAAASHAAALHVSGHAT